MKKNRLGVIFLLFMSVPREIDTTMREVLEKKYNRLSEDIQLIRHCFFHKDQLCMSNERQAARYALGRASFEGLMIMGMLALIVTGTYISIRSLRGSLKRDRILDDPALSPLRRTGTQQFTDALEPLRQQIGKEVGIHLSPQELKFTSDSVELKPTPIHKDRVDKHKENIINLLKKKFPSFTVYMWDESMGGWESF